MLDPTAHSSARSARSARRRGAPAALALLSALALPSASAPFAALAGCSVPEVGLDAGTANRRGAGADRAEAGDTVRDLVRRSAPFDVEHYAIDVDLDPISRSIRATCRVRLWPTVERLETAELDFADLDVDAVRDERGRELGFERTPSTLVVRLAEPVARGSFTELAVAYHGAPRLGLLFSAPRGAAATQAFTHHQPDDAHRWFPCADDPADRATTEITVTMPAAWIALAAGDRVERVELGARAKETWRMPFPHPPYLTSLVAGEFVAREGAAGGTPLAVLVAPSSATARFPAQASPQAVADFAEPRLLPLHDAVGAADRMLAWTADVLPFFERLTGQRYPYSKYAQACVDNFAFGGMENVSATTLTDTCLIDSAGEPDPLPVGLVAHEAAHQWFGDLVTCRDWSEAWLNEGFATYAAALYTEEARGADAFQLEMRAVRAAYLSRDTGANRRPIVWGRARDPLELFTSGHVYQGGAARLHCLRHVLGDDAFRRGIRAYVADHQGRSVTTEDLRRSMESASGVELGWFFEQWFHRAGFPELRVRTEHSGSAGELRVFVEQVQSGEPFRIPFEIHWKSGSVVRAERIDVDKRTAEFRWPCAEEPEWVVTDPGAWVPMRVDEERSAAAWQLLARTAPWAGVRADAVRAVRGWLDDPRARGSEAVTLDTLRCVARQDPVAAVRALAWELLPKSAVASAADVDEARRALAEEGDPVARTSLLRWLAGAWTDASAAELAQECQRRASTWREQAAALAWFASTLSAPARRAGASGPEQDAGAPPRANFDLLLDALGQDSWNGAGPALYLGEIAKLDDPRALDVLLAWAGNAAAPDPARIAAVAGLGARGQADPRARKLLVSLLDSERNRVRRQVVGELAAWRDPMLAPTLRAFAAAAIRPAERRAALDSLRATEDSP